VIESDVATQFGLQRVVGAGVSEQLYLIRPAGRRWHPLLEEIEAAPSRARHRLGHRSTDVRRRNTVINRCTRSQDEIPALTTPQITQTPPTARPEEVPG